MKHAREILFAALLTFLAPFVRAYEMRTWTAMNGKTTEAAYVKYESETQKVVMQKRDGSIIKVPRDSLCDDDWIYVSHYDKTILQFTIKCGEVPAFRVSLPQLGSRYASSTSGPGFSRIESVLGQVRSQLVGGESKLFFFVTSDNWMFVRCNNTMIAQIPYSSRFWNLFSPNVNRDRFCHSALFTSEEDEIGTKTFQHRTPNNQFADYAMWYELRGKREEKYTLLFLNAGWRDRETKWLSTENATTHIFVIRGLDQNKLKDIALNSSTLQSQFSSIPRYKRIKSLLESVAQGIPNDTPLPKESIGESKLLGTGSGFFISSDGYFLTNYHVVEGSKNIRLRTVFGNVSASVVRVDPAVDLALLKADKRGFVPLPFAAESSASLGEDIFTIGFPMPDLQGFSPKMTKGVISSLNGIQDDDVQYQIDASIQPGNSGGPLVNNQGELVGVIVSKLKDSLVVQKKGVLPQNVNYAIKKKHVLDFLAQVPACLHSIQTSNQPATGKSATPETIEAVQNSCAMVIVFE